MEKFENSQNSITPIPIVNPGANLSNNKKKYLPIFWILGVVLVFLLVGIVYLKIKSQPRIIKSLPKGYELKSMEAGKYPEGFPESMIFSGGDWQRAEDTKVASGERYRIVEIVYSAPGDVITEEYKKILVKAGWRIVELRNSNGSDIYSFTKNNEEMVLTFSPTSKDVFVNITYKTK